MIRPRWKRCWQLSCERDRRDLANPVDDVFRCALPILQRIARAYVGW